MYGAENEMFTERDYANPGLVPKLRAYIRRICVECGGSGVIVVCESPHETEECEYCHGEGELES